MAKTKPIITRSTADLAKALNLSRRDALELEVRAKLNDEIIKIARRSRQTHAQIAREAKTSRSRVTAILNRNTHEISTDLLLRILGALGYDAKITVRRSRPAA
jgi:predicted XRE-type DNA-binding protein